MPPRERILETAFTLFHKQGYNSTGINQIIAESTVAKASFYQHFKSKEDLCVEFLIKRHQYWFEKLRLFVSDYQTNETKLIASFDFLAYMNETENFRGCSFLNILSEIPEGNTKILDIIQNHKNDLRRYFRTFIDDVLLADHFYLLFESAIIESQLFRNQWPVVKAKTIIYSLLKKSNGTEISTPTI